MEKNYWSKVTSQRIGRRRALAVTGGAALGAAFLAACGDDDEPTTPSATQAPGATQAPSATQAPPGIISQPVYEPPSQAKRGGMLLDWTRAEPRSLDIVNPQANLNTIATECYSTLFVETPKQLVPSAYELQGDVAQSWEISEDGLQITVKLRPGVKFHNLPPVERPPAGHRGRALQLPAPRREGAAARSRVELGLARRPGREHERA